MGILQRLGGAAAILVASLGPAIAGQGCSASAVDLRGDFGTVRMRTELAITPDEQARGLMYREELPRLGSMLFVNGRERPLSFWMRNTLIPLDMLFIDDTGTVVRIHENAVPLDETPISSGEPALAVLEINGGLSAELGIEEGAVLRSPAMPQDSAAWPCD